MRFACTGKIRRIIFALALLLLQGQCLFAGDANQIDSLKRALQNTSDLGQRIGLYSRIAELFQQVDPDSSDHFARTALGLTDAKTPAAVMGEIYGCLGDVAVMRDSLTQAKEHYLRSADYFLKAQNWNKLIPVYRVLGNIFLVKDQLVTALNYYQKGIDLGQKYHITESMPQFFMNTGVIYQKIGNYRDALDFYHRALDGFQLSHDSVDVVISYINIGTCYISMNDYDLAENYFMKSLTLSEQMGNPMRLFDSYLNLSKVEQKKNNDSLSLRYVQQALHEFDKIGYDYAGPRRVPLAEAYAQLGNLYLKSQRLDPALENLQKSFAMARLDSQLSLMAQTAGDLATAWQQKKQMDSAYHYAQLHSRYYELQLNEDNVRHLMYQASKFEFEQQKRAAELEQLKAEAEKRRNYLILAIVIGVLAIVTILLFFRLKLGRNKLRQADLEKKNLKQQLEFRNRELTTHVMYQVKNKEFILKISEKLKALSPGGHPEFNKMLKEIVSEIEMDSNVDTWKEFEIRFQRVHTGFYKKLSEKYPDLTPNELRMCAFLKLNMTTKDIASITYQTTNSIDVARHRLRQKLALGKDENLVAFFSQF